MSDGHLGDADVGGLEASVDDSVGYVCGLHHVGVADGVFGATFAEGELGLGAAGADAAYVYVVLAELGVEGLGEANLGELGSAVNGLSSEALQASDGGDKLDDAAFLGDHQRRGVTGEEEAGLHVGVHEVVVLVSGGVGEVFVVAGAGVVDEDVELAEGAEGKGDGLLGGVFFNCVSGEVDGLCSEGFDLGAEGSETFGAASGDDEVGTLTSEGKSGVVANAGAGSCDQNYFSVEGGGRWDSHCV